MKTHNHKLMLMDRWKSRDPAFMALAVFVVLFCIVLVSGCSSMGSKFTSKKKADVELFAENTLSMLSQADLGFDKNQAVYIWEFIDNNGKEELAFYECKNRILDYFKKIIQYSLTLVVITETYPEEKDQVTAYTDFVSNFQEDTLKIIGIDQDQLNSITEEMKLQDEYLMAIQKAHPIIRLTSQSLLVTLDEMDVATDELAKKWKQKINDEYEDVIRYQELLEKEKYNVLSGFENVYRIYSGDNHAFEMLKKSGVIRKKQLISMAFPSEEQLVAIQDHLKARMAAIHMVEEQIKPDWEQYRATLQELDRVYATTSNRINRARMLSLLWLRAHQKMASGILSPAEWFNIKELPADLIKGGAKAIF